MDKVINPHWVDPLIAKKQAYETALTNYFAGLPTTKRESTFDELRAHFDKTPEQFSDGEIEYILNALGYEME